MPFSKLPKKNSTIFFRKINIIAKYGHKISVRNFLLKIQGTKITKYLSKTNKNIKKVKKWFNYSRSSFVLG